MILGHARLVSNPAPECSEPMLADQVAALTMTKVLRQSKKLARLERRSYPRCVDSPPLTQKQILGRYVVPAAE